MYIYIYIYVSLPCDHSTQQKVHSTFPSLKPLHTNPTIFLVASHSMSFPLAACLDGDGHNGHRWGTDHAQCRAHPLYVHPDLFHQNGVALRFAIFSPPPSPFSTFAFFLYFFGIVSVTVRQLQRIKSHSQRGAMVKTNRRRHTVAKMHRMPYLYTYFPAEELYFQRLFGEKRPVFSAVFSAAL